MIWILNNGVIYCKCKNIHHSKSSIAMKHFLFCRYHRFLRAMAIVLGISVVFTACQEEYCLVGGGEQYEMLPFNDLAQLLPVEGGEISLTCNDGSLSRFWWATGTWLDTEEDCVVMNDAFYLKSSPDSFTLEPISENSNNLEDWFSKDDVVADWILNSDMKQQASVLDRIGVRFINSDWNGYNSGFYEFTFQDWAYVKTFQDSDSKRHIYVKVSENNTGNPRRMCLYFYAQHFSSRGPETEKNNVVFISQHGDSE